MARWLETDTLSNQDISSALAIGAYTADADRLIVVDVSADQVAGNGDYAIYVTRQINGAGSAYVLLPKTTCAAASGETAIAMQSGMIAVRSGDVLTVYLDGLAGDTTTPDTIVRWFELAALQPATPGRTLAVDASGNVVLAAAQGAVTFGQVKVLANVSGEGALHVVNSHTSGYGQYNKGGEAGQQNWGSSGGGAGQLNTGGNSGLRNIGTAYAGQTNSGGVYGIEAIGSTADTEPSWVAPTASAVADAVRTELAVELAHLDADVSSAGGGLTAQETRDAMKLAPTAGDPAAGSVDAHLDSLIANSPVIGSGAITHIITINDGANPLEGVEVWITTDVGGSNVVAGTATTDSLGHVTFYLDAGTYYAWQQLTGYTFTNPTTITVA